MLDYDVVYNERPHYDNGPHVHGDDMLFVPVGGCFAISDAMAQAPRTLAHGAVWFVPGHHVHHVEASLGQRHLCYYVDMMQLSCKTTGPREMTGQPHVWPMSTLLHDLIRVRSHASSLLALPDGISRAAIDASILYEIARLSTTAVVSTEAMATVSQIKHFITNNLDHDLHCRALAARFCLSERTLNRWFSVIEGQSLGHYILQARLNEGARLLRISTLSIADIQAAVGFSSAAHFAYAIRKAFGRSPRVLRSEGIVAGNR